MILKNSQQFRLFNGEGIELEKILTMNFINKYQHFTFFSNFIKTFKLISFNFHKFMEITILFFINKYFHFFKEYKISIYTRLVFFRLFLNKYFLSILNVKIERNLKMLICSNLKLTQTLFLVF